MAVKVSIIANDIAPQLTQINDNEFLLQIDSEDIDLSLTLNAFQIQTLGLTCVHYIPDIEPRFAVAAKEEIYRHPAKMIGQLEDREIQTLLREIQSDEIKQFLWYMKDSEDIVNKFLNNMSLRAKEMMVEDIDDFYKTLHPDSAPMKHTEKARKATENLVNLMHHYQQTGEFLRF
ncbi:MAG: hypothetical protein GQ548_02065 [Methylophaga sp.]|nr:hypothetical protein [Methylophaga sp.]